MSEVASAVKGVLTDASSFDWLKDALQTALRRDPVDALNDALALAAALEAHLRAALGLREDRG